MSQDSQDQNPNPIEQVFNFKDSLIEALLYLKGFCLKPVESIKRAPDWQWQTLIATAFIVAVVFGALGGIIKMRVTSVIAGAIVFPFGTVIIVGTLSALMYYTSRLIFQVNLDLKRVATISFLACLPWIAAGPLVDYLPPLKPLAVLMSGFLAIVGFSENTHLTRKDVTRMVAAIVGVFVLFWIINMIRGIESTPDKEKLIDQQTLDILQQEMQKTKEPPGEAPEN